ncbi:MAG: ATP-binding protein [Nanopusillaceae archaeon]
MKVGYVIKEATSDYFYFAINPHYRNNIAIGSLLKININDTSYYAIVEDIRSEAIEEERLADFEAIEVIYDKIGKKIYILKGKAIFIGCLKNEKVLPEKPKTPPLPGDEVLLASYEEVEKIYSFDDEYTIPFGKILAGDKEYVINLSIKNLIIRHTGIFGITGSGKSTAVANIIYELSKRNIPIVVFDIHRDYILSFENPIIITFSKREKEYLEKITKERGINALIFNAKLNLKLLKDRAEIIGINETVMPHVYYLLEKILLTKSNITTTKELLEYLDSGEIKNSILKNYEEKDAERIVRSLKSRLNRVRDWRIFSTNLNDIGDDIIKLLDEIIEKLLKLESISEIEYIENEDEVTLKKYENLRNIILIDLYPLSIEEQKIVLDVLLEFLYEKYKKLKFEGRSDILGMVIEEAHRFVSKESKETAIKVSTIAREGRKFGLGLLLVSQVPSGILDSIISQINTFLLLKIINPKDLNFIRETCPYLSREYFKALTKLETGKCLVVGLSVKNPAIVNIIKKVSVGGAEEDIEKAIDRRIKLIKN